jgi:hypothetical protein
VLDLALPASRAERVSFWRFWAPTLWCPCHSRWNGHGRRKPSLTNSSHKTLQLVPLIHQERQIRNKGTVPPCGF